MFKVSPCHCCGSKAELRKGRVYIAEIWRVRCCGCGLTTRPVFINHPELCPGGLDESTRYTSEQAASIALAEWNARAYSDDQAYIGVSEHEKKQRNL